MKDYAFLVDIEQLIFDFPMFPNTDNKSSSLINKRMRKNRQWATNVFLNFTLHKGTVPIDLSSKKCFRECHWKGRGGGASEESPKKQFALTPILTGSAAPLGSTIM